VGITGYDIEMVAILKDQDDIRKLKASLRLGFPVLMANIVQILLLRNELKLANILTAHYEIYLTDDMLREAISQDHFQWLNWVWAFNKNYLEQRQKNKKISLYSFFKMI